MMPRRRWIGLLAAVSLVGAVACGTQPAIERTASPDHAIAWASPEAVGLDPLRLAAIHDTLANRVDSGEVAGAVVLLARRGRLVHLDSVGFADLDSRTPMRTDALFRIGSMTKPVTSVAVMLLVQDGLIALSDPISRYLPEFRDARVLVVSPTDSSTSVVPAEREITIQDLLTHRSGITYGFIEPGPLGDLYRQSRVSDGIGPTAISLDENVRRLAALPLRFHPGSGHSYGLSIHVLGRLIEVVSGLTLPRFLEDRLFAPLGMRDTYFHVPDDEVARLATPYTWRRSEGLRVMPSATRWGDLSIAGEGHRGSTVYFSGGAGLISTATDYLRFLQMILDDGRFGGRQVLRSETVELMMRSYTDDLAPPPMGVGYGMAIGFVLVTGHHDDQTVSVGTLTQPGIYGTTFWVDPAEELVGIVMTQRYPIGSSLTIDDRFQRAVYDAIVN